MAEGCGVPIAPVASKKRMPQIQEPLAGRQFRHEYRGSARASARHRVARWV